MGRDLASNTVTNELEMRSGEHHLFMSIHHNAVVKMLDAVSG